MDIAEAAYLSPAAVATIQQTLTPHQLDSLRIFKQTYRAQALGFDAATARRLAFVKWLGYTGRLGGDDQASETEIDQGIDAATCPCGHSWIDHRPEVGCWADVPDDPFGVCDCGYESPAHLAAAYGEKYERT